jgi:WD40 repeat protein
VNETNWIQTENGEFKRNLKFINNQRDEIILFNDPENKSYKIKNNFSTETQISANTSQNKREGEWLDDCSRYSFYKETSINAHKGAVLCLTILKNGDFASASADKNIKIWSSIDSKSKSTLSNHTDKVNALVVSPNGYLVSGSRDKTIKIWNNGRVIKSIDANKSIVYSLKYLKDENLAAGSDYVIRIWNTSTGIAKTPLAGHFECVSALATLKNGDLISGSCDSTIKIWNIETGKLKITLNEHKGLVSSLVVLENGDLASSSPDTKIKIWNLKTNQAKLTLSKHSKAVNALVELKNGFLASGSDDKTVRIWDAYSGALIKTIQSFKSSIKSLAVLNNGALVVGGDGGEIKVIRTCNVLASFKFKFFHLIFFQL